MSTTKNIIVMAFLRIWTMPQRFNTIPYLCIVISASLVPVELAEQTAQESSSFLNVDELNNVLYEVSIDGKPVLVTEGNNEVPGSSFETVTMTNKFGQTYLCQLPFDFNLGKRDEGPEEPLTVEEINDKLKRVLKDLENGPCLTRTKGWWTYEICPGKLIKQYHIESGQPKGNIIILGFFNLDLPWTSVDRTKQRPLSHRQTYENGTRCDVTGNLRRTEVKYNCNQNSPVDEIVDVKEPFSCEYLISVETKRLCDIPYFKPPPDKEPLEIPCKPALTKEQYEKYEQIEKEKQAELERKAAEFKKEHKNKLLKFLDAEAEDNADVQDDDDETLGVLEELFEQKMAESLLSKVNDVFEIMTGGGNGKTTAKSLKSKFLEILEDIRRKGKLRSLGFRRHKKELSIETSQSLVQEIAKDASKISEDQRPSSKDEERKVQNDDTSDKAMKRDIESDADKTKPDSIEERIQKGTLEKEDELFDHEMERKVRSDVVSEEEMISDLEKVFRKLDPQKQEEISQLSDSKEFHQNLEEALSEIVDESERELGTQLNPNERAEIKEFSAKIKEIMQQLSENEAKINKVNKELKKVQKTIDDEAKIIAEETPNEYGDELDDDVYDLDGRDDLKHDNKRSVKKELREEDEEEYLRSLKQKRQEKSSKMQQKKTSTSDFKANSDVDVVVHDIHGSSVSGLSSTSTDSKIAKRVESLLKSKMNGKDGLVDSKGRQVQVKVVTLHEVDPELAEEFVNADSLEPGESQQIQGMIHNLFAGDKRAYDDIDKQRKMEKSYNFNYDSLSSVRRHSNSEDQIEGDEA